MADSIVVMYLGRVAEASGTATIFERPQHPYTEALMAAKPDLRDDQDARIRCALVTPACGWEAGHVLRWLETSEGMFDTLTGVARSSPFAAELAFADRASAERPAGALRSDAVPAAMRAALDELAVSDGTVRLRFRAVGEIALTDRGPGQVAACILERGRS